MFRDQEEILSRAKLKRAQPDAVMRLGKYLRLPKRIDGQPSSLNQTIGWILWKLRLFNRGGR
jgi:hypothetical protein